MKEYREDKTAVDVLPPYRLFGGNGQIMRVLEGMGDRYAPLNDWMHDVLRPHAAPIIADKFRYTVRFRQARGVDGAQLHPQTL